MKVDSIISLACSMYAKKGVYALLLGSGISRASGIPTGWEITLDLIKKMMVLHGEVETNNPENWYIEKYKNQPDYSDILAELAKTSVERNNLLRSYFEPLDDPDDMYGKPTKAHRAIAQLIKDGYIRVVLTTNFDRLLEKALAEINIVPNIISNVDQIEGAMPLIHSGCTIVKVHGDYLDVRIKNTEKELSEFAPQLNKYLDCILDEFGLIVCGWSGIWDIALRNCIFRTKNNRFSWYWLKKGSIGEETQKLIDFKKFELIDIEDADNFFETLKDKIDSLDDLTMRQSSLSIDLACSTLKRLLPDNKNIIRINDLIMDTAKEVIDNISKLDWRVTPDNLILKQRTEQIENICELLLNLISLGCYWGKEEYDTIWTNCFKYIYNNSKLPSNTIAYAVWSNLLNYPALLVMYVILMSCIESGRFVLLNKILNDSKSNKENRYDKPTAISNYIYPEQVIEREVYKKAYQCNHHVPVSERMYDILRKPISKIVNSEEEYNNLFDKAEYLYAVNFWYREKFEFKKTGWAPVGRFGYKLRHSLKIENLLESEFMQKDDWAAIKAGFFGGSFNNFVTCSTEVEKWVASIPGFF